MEILLAVFGFFSLLSLVALVKFQGNPVFIFSFLLCTASLLWLIRLHLDEAQAGRSSAAKSRKRHVRR